MCLPVGHCFPAGTELFVYRLWMWVYWGQICCQPVLEAHCSPLSPGLKSLRLAGKQIISQENICLQSGRRLPQAETESQNLQTKNVGQVSLSIGTCRNKNIKSHYCNCQRRLCQKLLVFSTAPHLPQLKAARAQPHFPPAELFLSHLLWVLCSLLHLLSAAFWLQ